MSKLLMINKLHNMISARESEEPLPLEFGFDTPGKQYNGSSLGHGEKLSKLFQCQTRVNRFSTLKKTGTFHAKHVEMQSQHEVVPNHVGDCMTVRRVAKVFWAI